VLGIGPGLFWKITEDKAFWLNTYKETGVENRSRADYQVQVRYVHKF
ncbi:MAG: phenol degradation protein meta, partial [Pseudomonas sp.]